MDLGPQRGEDLLEAIRLMEVLRSELSGAEDFDSVRMDSHLVTALTSARAALGLFSVLNRHRGDFSGDHIPRS